jgi:hypothetical protein
LHFPPAAAKPIVQASAGECMHVQGTLRMYPREIRRLLLRSLRKFDEFLAWQRPFANSRLFSAAILALGSSPAISEFHPYRARFGETRPKEGFPHRNKASSCPDIRSEQLRLGSICPYQGGMLRQPARVGRSAIDRLPGPGPKDSADGHHAHWHNCLCLQYAFKS